MGCCSKFARCCAVVVEVFPKIMQELLATRIQAVDLYDTVIKNADFKNRLSGNEMFTIQTLMTNGFSKLNDTLIYKIVKFFDLIPSPTQNWGAHPLVNETEIGDTVERIRLTRRKLVFRIDCDIDELEFQNMFNGFIQLGLRVDIYLKKSNDLGFRKNIKRIKTIPMADHQEFEYIQAIKELKAFTVKNFQITSEESEHLSKYLNAFDRSLPLVKLVQSSVRRYNEITEIIYGVLGSCICNYKVVGSVAEGLHIVDSDLDHIVFSNDLKVFDSKKESHNIELEHFQFLRLPDERHPGYSKLCVISLDIKFGKDNVNKYTYEDLKDGNVYLKNNVKGLVYYSENLIDYRTHGPAHYHEFDQEKFEAFFKPEKIPTIKIKNIIKADIVVCIRCKQWPVEASEWTTRRRASNWPTKELFHHIINTGYLLAGVGSKESKESEIQWRVSFNEAEQLIIESFNETQIHCIVLLKLMKNICLSHIAGKNITSYTMKTVMFWCLDEKSDAYWQSSNLASCFCFSVSKLESFVERGFLPNYFIRKRNQFVAKEFTCVIRNKTRKDLEVFLNNPKACINLLFPSYREHANTQIWKLNVLSQKRFIEHWIRNKGLMAAEFQFNFWNILLKLFNGYSIEGILKRCNDALEKLNTSIKTKPLIKKLLNHMGVLQYILLMEEKETVEHRTDSDLRERYSKYMKQSATGDLTHSTLRSATCHLDDDVKKDCLNIIRTVTDDEKYFMQLFSERLEQTINCDIEALRKIIITLSKLPCTTT